MRKIFAALAIVGTALAIGLVGAPASAVNPTLDFYISAPVIQNTYVTGAEVATFNGVGSTTNCTSPWQTDSSVLIGTITSAAASDCRFSAADAYGGASSSQNTPNGTPVTRNQGNSFRTSYVSVMNSKTVTLSLAQSENYLGFWWAAGDSGNNIKLYSGGTSGTLVGSFSTSTLITMLNGGSGTVSPLGGGSYNTCDYFKNPVNPDSPCPTSGGGEPFAYVHLIGSNGLTFDTVVFSQTAGGNFEFDNMAIARVAVTPDNSLVSFPPNLVAGNSTQAATTCSSFTSNIDWTASNFSSNPSYSVSPAMPAGLSFSSSTGEITGTPTAVSSSTTYTVTATAGAQSKTATFALAVTAGSSTACPTTTPAALPNTGTSALPGVIGVGILITGAAAIVAAVLLRRKRG